MNTTVTMAKIDSCLDRTLHSHPELSDSIQEVKGGLHRIFKNAPAAKGRDGYVSKTINDLKSKDIVIMPSDKSKRLVALDNSKYEEMLNSFDDEYTPSKFIKPQSSQNKFNKSLSLIACKYPGTTGNFLKSLTCSEPIPSTMICLPKDHKPGPLKGRPVVAAVDGPSTKLSRQLAGILNKLLHNIPAHLSSSTAFVDSISNLTINPNCQIASLDVSNLYGSIPLSGRDNIFEIATNFFDQHRQETPIPQVSKEDFQSLLELCLCSDTISINGKPHTQSNGLAMGNNAAPTLATIFMDFVERKILQSLPGITFWKRYLDDIFLIYENLDSTTLLSCVNSVHPAIKFTIEPMINNQIPFLDILISRQGGSLQYQLFMKSSHSGHILPWSSHHPRQTKIGVAVGEFLRAKRLSSSSQLTKASSQLIENKLLCNGYPQWVIRKARSKAFFIRNALPKPKLPTLSLPFVNDVISRQCHSLLHRTGLKDKLRICFRSRPLSSLLRPPRGNSLCDDNCNTCSCAEKPGFCFLKNVVYLISCVHCSETYIGETGRTVNSRIREHLSRPSSAVFRHLLQHGDPDWNSISWKILHKNVRGTSVRKRVELTEIRAHSPSINTLDPVS
jgi:hypothetical protein